MKPGCGLCKRYGKSCRWHRDWQSVNPPRPLLPHMAADFSPAHDLEHWARATFIEQDAALHNPEHSHLTYARLGFLWALPPWKRRGRVTLANAEPGKPPPSLSGWKRERLMAQLEEWFGRTPLDFVITFWLPGWQQLDDRAACALTEHELLHCGQAIDEFGAPRFSKQGRPLYALRGHDVEEFTSVVVRYGAWSPDLEAMREALGSRPALPTLAIAGACGTCKAA